MQIGESSELEWLRLENRRMADSLRKTDEVQESHRREGSTAMRLLAERTSSGFNVRLSYDAQENEVILYGKTEQHVATALVAPERALEAFQHPCLYLEAPERFFRRNGQ